MSLPFDPTTLPEFLEQGYLIGQAHPTLPLTIYNYTAKTQYERVWTDVTLNCRGLVLDGENQLVARPLPKFFNLDEYQEPLPSGAPVIYEKLDGSLILLFFYGGEWQMASRGSFISPQVEKSRTLLPAYREELDGLDRAYTYLLEVIYPENRIVVDYGAAERLVMLGAVQTATGQELDLAAIAWRDRAQVYPIAAFPEWLKSMRRNQSEFVNQEGFILKWPNGLRLKYKLADYVRLHRLLTRVQAKDIWECLSQNQDLEAFLEAVPDEFYQWVKQVRSELEAQYSAIEEQCRSVFKDLGDRKTTAAYFQTQAYPQVLFLMLDGRDYSPVIWRQIKPKYQRPFRSDNEG